MDHGIIAGLLVLYLVIGGGVASVISNQSTTKEAIVVMPVGMIWTMAWPLVVAIRGLNSIFR